MNRQQELTPEEKIKRIRQLLREWLTPDERRQLETELLKLVKATATAK